MLTSKRANTMMISPSLDLQDESRDDLETKLKVAENC